MMHIHLKKPTHTYPIHIDADWQDVASWLPKKAFSQIVIISDDTIQKHYGLQLQQRLQNADHQSILLSFKDGEHYKNPETKQTLEQAMLAHYCDRQTLIIALGGGVVGDVAGFVAATYMRGISYIQIPTTLLAMVDASIGGKTGINTPFGKNLIGAIHQPMGVVIDVALLQSLPEKHLINGFIEIIKIFLTSDAPSFYDVYTSGQDIIHNNQSLLKKTIIQAIKLKAAVVKRDELELGERGLLNFGHTIGHALEKITKHSLLHGYAVGYGILIETEIAYLHGLLTHHERLIIKQCLAHFGIYGKDLENYDVMQIIQATKNDKKNRQGQVHYVLLKSIGNVYTKDGLFVHPVHDEMVQKAFKEGVKHGR